MNLRLVQHGEHQPCFCELADKPCVHRWSVANGDGVVACPWCAGSPSWRVSYLDAVDEQRVLLARGVCCSDVGPTQWENRHGSLLRYLALLKVRHRKFND